MATDKRYVSSGGRHDEPKGVCHVSSVRLRTTYAKQYKTTSAVSASAVNVIPKTGEHVLKDDGVKAVIQFAYRFGLNLPDALARDAHSDAYFIQSHTCCLPNALDFFINMDILAHDSTGRTASQLAREAGHKDLANDLWRLEKEQRNARTVAANALPTPKPQPPPDQAPKPVPEQAPTPKPATYKHPGLLPTHFIIPEFPKPRDQDREQGRSR